MIAPPISHLAYSPGRDGKTPSHLNQPVSAGLLPLRFEQSNLLPKFSGLQRSPEKTEQVHPGICRVESTGPSPIPCEVRCGRLTTSK